MDEWAGREEDGRWRALFDDLEGQVVESEVAELAAEVADRTRREVALLRLVDRLRPAVGDTVRIGLLTGEGLSARLGQVGADWLLLHEEPAGHELLVPLAAVTSVAGLGRYSAAPGSEGLVARKLDFRLALRAVARDRSHVVVQLRDGVALPGRVERVGADFLEIATSYLDGIASRCLTVALRAVVLVRRT